MSLCSHKTCPYQPNPFNTMVLAADLQIHFPHPLTFPDPDEMYDHHRRLTVKQAIEREENRFKVADQDGNGKLNKDEFANFLHPGNS